MTNVSIQIGYFQFRQFFPFTEAYKIKSLSEELEKVQKQLKQEQLLKAQAVNKLAEIMNRKDMNHPLGKNKKVSSTDLRKKEKECRKLQLELTQVF